MTNTNTPQESLQLQSCKIIQCMLPDDGTDINIMQLLKNDKAVTRVSSIACRGVHNLQLAKTRSDKLPEPSLYRFLSVIVSDEQADEIFDFIYTAAQIGQPGRGAMLQSTLLGATAYSLPDNIPNEKS